MPPKKRTATPKAPANAQSPAKQNGDPEEAILDAARACFKKWGVDRTRMDDIAEAERLAALDGG